jgi:hypothetical protein
VPAVRRLLVLVVVGGLALAALVIPGVPAGGQTAPPATVSMFSLSPRCVAAGGGAVVQASGATNQGTVSLVLYAPSGGAVNKGSATVSGGGWSGSLDLSAREVGFYELRATAGAATATGFIEVPCQAPTLEYSPTCFPVGYDGTVTMTGRHFAPFGQPYTVTYDLGGTEQQRAIRQVGDNHGVTSTTFKVTPSNRPHPGEISDGQRTLVATATWSPCPPGPTTTTTSTTTTSTTAPVEETTTTEQPSTTTTRRPDLPGPTVTVPPLVPLPPPTPGATLAVHPELGPAGFVTTATGTGFPPNGTVELHWQPGVGQFTATTGADGTFVAHALVFPKDRLGPRALVATSGGTTAFDAFLVVASTVQPSGQSVAQITRTRRFLQR